VKTGVCLALVVVISACIPAVTYTHTAESTFATKPRDCEFRIQSTIPSPEEYIELGTLNGCQGTTDMSAYKERVREKVCGAGGDLVVGQVNGYGVYCLGVVFKKK